MDVTNVLQKDFIKNRRFDETPIFAFEEEQISYVNR